MAEKFDLVVIGTGVAAQGIAARCRKAGRSVAVIDCRPFGGTCPLRGCDPKKALNGGATALDHAARMDGKGIASDGLHIDWPALVRFKRGFTDPVTPAVEKKLADSGIAGYRGQARFVGRSSVDVEGTVLEATHVVIANGADPIPLGIPGEEHLIDHEDFMSLETLPRRIAMVGGGYIAAEFSHLAARAGAQVTVLQNGDRMLAHFEPELVDWLMARFRTLGIDVRTGTTVERIENTADGYRVTASRDGQSVTTDADLVVHAAGRAPALKPLDLEAAGVETEKGRLVLNDYLQSVSNPAVYAAGDAAQQGPPLTPVASHDAAVVAANLLDGNRRKPDYRGVPSVAFTIPPIAAVGLGEAAAREQHLRFRVNKKNAGDWFTARQAAEPVYGYKVLIEEPTDRIIGAHLVGPHVEEVINIFALAIRQNLTTDALKSTIFAYPTGASDIESML